MRRILRIAIYAVIILGMYFWIMTYMKSCDSGSNSPSKQPITQDTIDPLDSLITGMDTLNHDSIETEESLENKSTSYEDVDKKVEEIEKDVALPKVSAPPSSPKQNTEQKPIIKTPIMVPKANQPTKIPEPKVVKSGDGGKYMVMAGSYLLEENAESMVKKLKKMGYPNAKVVVFSNSQYHSVIAASYSGESSAIAVVSELKRKGIDTYVKSK
jgi:cell division protein FtsN